MREMNLTFRNPDEVLDFVKTVESSIRLTWISAAEVLW